MCRNLLLGFTLFLAGAAQADTLFHWRFDGSYYDSVVSDTDVVNSHVATKFADSGGPSPVLAVEYGRADPWYNTVGTSADFQNDPVSNDPGVGLRVGDAGPDSMLDLGTVSACTVEAFVCPYFDSRQSVILRKYSPGCYYIDTRPASHSYSGKGVFAVRLANATFDTGDNGALCHDLPYEANQWYHVALVWTGSKMKFYVNGVQSQQLGGRYDLGYVPGTGVAEVDFPGPIGDTERALGIGCIIRDNQDPPASSGQFFYGRIDEMRISDVALAPLQFLLNAEPELAFNPSPHSCAPDVRPDVNLVWSPGIGAASHDVYLGTNCGDVNDGTGGTFRGNQEPNSYDPQDLLEFGRTYYWRIDEVGATTVRGYVWQFAVEDGKAGNPGPPNESSGVGPAVVLSWTPGVLAERHDVYLGTDFDDVNDAADPNVLPGRGPQDVNSYNPPGDLQTNVTYYWRIDEVSGATVVKGDIWSFTVAEIFTNSLGMKFVRIEPGTFQMGSTNGDFDEVPVHNVTITEPFYISQFEVTNAEYEQFDPNHGLIDHRGFTHEPNEAVIFVSWEDANAFCTWLSQLEGTAYRLPTEAEWEHACRAGTTAEYYTGGTLPEVYYKNQVETWGPNPQPLHVGQTPSNQWGLYDMHGNVEEWCWDWYGPYEANDQTDPVGRVDGRFRVSRGGSHSTTVDYLRSANRMGTLPEDKHWMIGFRPVLAELPTTEPLPEPPPELYQIDVDQTVPPDINQGPDPDIPYFQGPRTYVKIPPGSDGPLFSAHNHDPGFTECPNGDLLAIWYTTIREPGRELALAASRLRYGRDEWEDASPFWDAPDRNDHAPALWIDESGKIYHFVGLGDAATWGGAALIMRTSMDNGVTWSRARLIDPEHTYDHMPVESIFRANDGAILLPSDKNPGTHIYLSYDDGQTWFDPGGRIYGIHAGVVQLNDDRLMAFGRREEIDNKMPMSISADMGASWTYSASEFPPIGGGQRPVVLRLKEGPILFISFTGDDGMMIDGQTVYGMFAALSYDEGQTWPVKKLITAGGPPTQYDGGGNTGLFIMDDTHAEPRGYLAITQTPNGVIQLISSALHYRFNLAWLEYEQYVLIDDFESYTDDGGENPIGDTWQDSSSDPDNGTIVSLDMTIVRGYKSMKVDYDTAWPYCRAVRTYSLGQNWAAGDVKAMSLWFYGSNYNSSSDQMYVLVKDINGNIGLSLYAGEANDIAEERWQQWHVDLEDFHQAGADLTDANLIAVGIEGTGAGHLYFDDIRLYPTRCVPEFGPAGDLTDDCIVKGDDLKIMAGDWLEADRIVTGINPDPNGLLLWYRFDESSGYTVTDYSGRDCHGDLVGPEGGWDPSGGYDSGCRVFSDDTAVAVPTEALAGIGGKITFMVWLNGIYRADYHNWVFDTGSGDCFLQAAAVTIPDKNVVWRAGCGDDVVLWDLDGRDPLDLADEWHHWAFVKDANEGLMAICFDGSFEAEKTDSYSSCAGVAGTPFDIGAIISHMNDYIGKMDDFRIYDYALSQAEIVGAATGGGDLFVPAPASDIYSDGKVNFADYALLTDTWLQEKFWP